MNELTNALWIEQRKVLRSKVPLLTVLGFMILPLAGAFLMFIYKDPDFARKSGLISAKANLMGGSADWPSYLNMLTQGMAIGGFMIFSLVESWVFGREFSDGTLKDMLAVPVPRLTLLLAKFIVAAAWSAGMALIVYLVGLGLGVIVVLPEGSAGILAAGSLSIAGTTGLVIAVVTPIAFFASLGRGYLLPLGAAILIVATSQIAALLGWGYLFPWSVPALYAGMLKDVTLGPISYWIVALTCLAGVAGTYLWWQYADQSR